MRTRRSAVGWVVAFPDYLLRKRSDLWDGTGGTRWDVVCGRWRGGGREGKREGERKGSVDRMKDFGRDGFFFPVSWYVSCM